MKKAGMNNQNPHSLNPMKFTLNALKIKDNIPTKVNTNAVAKVPVAGSYLCFSKYLSFVPTLCSTHLIMIFSMMITIAFLNIK